MNAPEKRPLIGHEFAKRFILFLILSVVLVTVIVYVCDHISPELGEATGRWALLVAIFSSWHAARHWSPAERDAYAARMPPTDEAAAPLALYYFRLGLDGAMQGPDTLPAIRSCFPDTADIQIVESTGQSQWALKRSLWLPFPE
jgi:hypothetical protein